jgi:hypothetical protein
VSHVKYELGFYIPEDGILHSHHRENLKSYIYVLWLIKGYIFDPGEYDLPQSKICLPLLLMLWESVVINMLNISGYDSML